MEYGLIGGKLGHSYSKLIHEMLCGYRYDLCPLPTEADARAFLEKRAFKAINVTLPYKRLVMEYCSFIDPRAKAIGAVNTVVNHNGLLYGYNTDYLGFAHLCAAHGVDFTGRTVLILGTGGTHNTTSAVARDKGAAKILTVSRKPDPAKGELSYEEAVHSGAQIVINTTPAGMYPNVGTCNLDIAAMPGLEAVLDVVYNPEKTEIILRAEEAGVPVAASGLEMLVAQAVYAAEYFLDRKFEDAPAEISRVTAAIRRDTLNVVLIGMPSSGKSTIGRMLAEKLGKRFLDLDDEVVKADGRTIPEIFAAEGEDSFRRKETEQTARFAKEGAAAALLRGRRHQAAREHPAAAPERRHPLFGPPAGSADRGRRQAALLQHRRPPCHVHRAQAAVSGGSGRRCAQPHYRHGRGERGHGGSG